MYDTKGQAKLSNKKTCQRSFTVAAAINYTKPNTHRKGKTYGRPGEKSVKYCIAKKVLQLLQVVELYLSKHVVVQRI